MTRILMTSENAYPIGIFDQQKMIFFPLTQKLFRIISYTKSGAKLMKKSERNTIIQNSSIHMRKNKSLISRPHTMTILLIHDYYK